MREAVRGEVLGLVPIVVKGIREATRAIAKLNKSFPRDVRRALKSAVEPVRADAEILAGQQVRNLGDGDPWTGMRTQAGVKMTYIAPKQRGRTSRHNPKRRRPNLKPRLLRAMETAGERNSNRVKQSIDRVMLDAIQEWGRG